MTGRCCDGRPSPCVREDGARCSGPLQSRVLGSCYPFPKAMASSWHYFWCKREATQAILSGTVKSLSGGPGGRHPQVREVAGSVDSRPLADLCNPNSAPKKAAESGLLLRSYSWLRI